MQFKVSLLLFLFLLCASAVALAQTPAEQDDVIRVETDITNLLFTATDKQKRFVTTLRQEDIRVLEDGVRQELFTFQQETDRPLSIALLIDVSISEQRTLPQEKAAARSFIETVIRSSKDQVAIIPFTGTAYLEQPLTRDVLGIFRALERVDIAAPSYLGTGTAIGGIRTGPGLLATPPEGSTAIWDAVAVSATEVLDQSQDQRRRAIILLTDGQDTTSRVTHGEAINRALAAECVIYAIGIGDKKYGGVEKGKLRDIAERTGGRAFFPKKEDDLTAAFVEIEKELRTQYLIAYSSTNKRRDGAYREVKIEITNPVFQEQKLKVRHRPGYFAKPLTGPRR
ncbi:MAG TPA: VWA domain-containing protein [Pyrinomonadaceae bacterium]|jgi:VWFA-related protein